MKEEWKPVVGFEGYYEISNFGRVKSLPRQVAMGYGATRTTSERIMRTKTHGKPGREYVYVGLRVNSEAVNRSIHSLVLEAFVGPRPPGWHGCHSDGNTKNNMLSNLRWDTPAGNEEDKLVHGRLRGRKKQLDRTHCNNGHPLRRDDEGLILKCLPCLNMKERGAREVCPKCGIKYEGVMNRKDGSFLRRYCIPCLDGQLENARKIHWG